MDIKQIYTQIKNESDDDYSNDFKRTSSYFVDLLNKNQNLNDDDLKLLFIKQSNGIADAGQWGACNQKQFNDIRNVWNEIYEIIKQGKSEHLSGQQYLKVRDTVKESCNRDKKLIVNRVFATFFPTEVTATCKEDDFYIVANFMNNNYSDYPEITENWLLDNYAFISYCKENISEDNKLPFAVFSWKLKEAINKGLFIEKGDGVMDKLECYSELLLENKNIILHGAPGTGKTHLVKDIAANIICGKKYDELTEEEQNQIGFVQFHPSYDYTDFVEGLRPVEKFNGEIGFERKDGVFKKFCEKAILSSSDTENIWKELNDNPTVWKVSLEGTGDNPTRTDCMTNGYIRIGWSSYGEVADFSKFSGYTEDGGSVVLVAFQSKMKVGDIVLSCYSATEIDAIGIVTGEYEYRPEGGNYPRYRTVKWLVKGIRENIVEKNRGKSLTLASVYKLSISIQDVFDIVKKYTMNQNQHSESVNENNKAFVFIIDEINRGELSKIFGELFYAIDPGYRGINGKINTQYQNLIKENNIFYTGFYIPENVYIIGTMNDIDRSVESMDFAMRRRFIFEEVTAEYSAENMNLSSEAKERMKRINDVIANTEGLNDAYKIGGAYFLNVDDFDKLWKIKLSSLVKEYLRGIDDDGSKYQKIEDAYFNRQVNDYSDNDE